LRKCYSNILLAEGLSSGLGDSSFYKNYLAVGSISSAGNFAQNFEYIFC
jgi:hypothetical protein